MIKSSIRCIYFTRLKCECFICQWKDFFLLIECLDAKVQFMISGDDHFPEMSHFHHVSVHNKDLQTAD